MKQMFLLSQENLLLAQAEVLSLCNEKKHSLFENLLICDAPDGLWNRLGYTHTVFEHITSSHKLDELFDKGLKDHIKGTVSLRAHDLLISESDLATKMWPYLGNPKVDLKNPDTEIHVFRKGDRFHLGILESDCDKTYNGRKAHLRPALHPSSLHPKLARACINLTGVSSGKLFDPFCGTGGILIEAGLMGYDLIGADIETDMLDRSRMNLEHYGLSANFRQMDSLKETIKADCIVTDVPYGKNTRNIDNISEFYKKALLQMAKSTDHAVFISLGVIDVEKQIKSIGWKVSDSFDIYIHKSMTKRILNLFK